MQLPPIVGELAFGALALLAALPLVLTEHPPIQDYPQHLAAVRVIHSLADPAFDFGDHFVLEPARTQYLSVYYLASLLAHVIGVSAALKLVLVSAIVGLPFAVRGLAGALGRSPMVGLLVLPLTYSAHYVLGFLNFVAALPLMFLAMTIAAKERKAPSRWGRWACAAILVLCFYTHIVPFAISALGVGLLFAERSRGAAFRSLGPLVALALAVLPWLLHSPAGQTLRRILSGGASGHQRPTYDDWDLAWSQLPRWLTDVWSGEWDRWCLLLWLLCVAVWGFSGFRHATWRGAAGHRRKPRLALRLAVLPFVSALAYFFAPSSYDWIWPINARFALIALLLLLPLLPTPHSQVRFGVQLVNGLLAALTIYHVTKASLEFERKEVAGLGAAIEQIPRNQHVVGLIFQAGSGVVDFAPFLHSVAYYQAARGGVVMFTFADFPQSVVRFREDARPARVAPRWEWLASRVEPDAELDFYDWILARGLGQRLEGSRLFERVFVAGRWSVWKRREENQPPR